MHTVYFKKVFLFVPDKKHFSGKVIKEEDIKDDHHNQPEWFQPNLAGFNDPLLPPLMPGYGAPDLYGQDIASLRNKRKPIQVTNNNVEVTTYKPHFDNDNVVNNHEKSAPTGFGGIPSLQPQGHLSDKNFHRELFQQQQQPYGILPYENGIPNNSR